jgi:DNA-binding protein H-NS
MFNEAETRLTGSLMAVPKIDKLTYEELFQLRDNVESTIARRRTERKVSLRKEMAQLASEAGFSLQELVPQGRTNGSRRADARRGPVAPKYRNSKDPSQTWAGRGRQPKWLVAELEKGRKLESFLIQ